MAGDVLAALKVVLGLDTGLFQRGATQAALDAQKLQKRIESVGRKMTTIGVGLSAAITAPFTALVASAIPAARESAEAMGQVNAALASMGPVAGRTADQLQKQATALMNISTFDDDDILRNVTANMLTFGRIAGENFDRAQMAAVDLSTRLKIDLQSATILVGKALNDPVKGLAALSRAGIQFSESQKTTIRQMVALGDKAGAQKIILNELEAQFGGSAKAMRDATPDAALANQWDTLKEAIGKVALDILPKILPPITRLVAAFNDLSPGTQAVTVGAVALVAALGPVLIAVDGIVTSFAAVGPAILAVAGGFTTLATGIVTAAIPTIGSLIVALAPILLPLGAVAAAAAAVYYAWQNWDRIQPIVERVWVAVKTRVSDGFAKVLGAGKMLVMEWFNAHRIAFEFISGAAQKLFIAIRTWLQDRLASVWKAVTDKVEAVKKTFFGLYDAVVGHSYIPDMVDEIGGHMARLQTTLVKPSQDAIDDAKRIFEKGAGDMVGFLEKQFGQDPLLAPQETPGPLFDAKASGSDFDGFIADMNARLVAPAEKGTARIATAFSDMTRTVGDSLSRLSGAIKGGKILDIISETANTIGSILGAIKGIGGLFGGKKSSSQSFGGFRANGGPVTGGKAYLVGERGPEIFAPRSTGRIVSNADLGSGSGGLVFDLRGAVMTEALLADINQRIASGEARAVTGGANLALRNLGQMRRRALA